MNKAEESGVNSREEIEREVESMICDGLLVKRDGGLYPTELGDFVIEYTEKVELGLIKPSYKTWEKEYIRFIERRKDDYIILKHSVPDYNDYKKWL
jgi:hypothetical protein